MLLGASKPSSHPRAGPTAAQQSKLWKSQIEEVLKKAADSRDWIASVFGTCRGWLKWDGSLLSGIQSGVVYSVIESKPDWCKLLAGIIIKPIASFPGLEELENLSRGNRWEISKEEEVLTMRARNLIEKVQVTRAQVKSMVAGELSKQFPHKDFEISLLLLFQIYQLGISIPELQSLKDQAEKFRRSDSLVSNTLLTTEQLRHLIEATSGTGNGRVGDSQSNHANFSLFRVNDGCLSNPSLLALLRDEVIQSNMRQRLEVCQTVESAISRLLELSSMSVKDLCNLCNLLDTSATLKLTFDHIKHVSQLRDSFKWVLFLKSFIAELEAGQGVRLERCSQIDHLLVEPNPETFDRARSLEWVKSNLASFQDLSVDEELNFQFLESKVAAFMNILHTEPDHNLLAELLKPTSTWQLLDPQIQRLINLLSQANQQLQVRGIMLGPNCSIDDLELIEEELDRQGEKYLPILTFVRRQLGKGIAYTKDIQSLVSQLVQFTLKQDESSIAFTQNQQALRKLQLEFDRIESELSGKVSQSSCEAILVDKPKVIVANNLIKSKTFKSCLGILGLLSCASSLGLKGTISREELSQLEPFFQVEEYHKLKSHQLVATIIETRNQLKIYEELLGILDKHEPPFQSSTLTQGQAEEVQSGSKQANEVASQLSDRVLRRNGESKPRLQISQVREHLTGMVSGDCVIDYSKEVERVAQKVQEFESFEKRALNLAQKGALGFEVFSEENRRIQAESQVESDERLPLLQAWRFLSKTTHEVNQVLDGLLNSPFYAKVESDMLALEWALESLRLWLEADPRWGYESAENIQQPELCQQVNQDENMDPKDEDPDYILHRRSSSEDFEAQKHSSYDLADSVPILPQPISRQIQSASGWATLLSRGHPYKSLQPVAYKTVQQELDLAEDLISQCRVSVVENVKYRTLVELQDRIGSLRIDISDDLHYFQERLALAKKIAEQIDRAIVGKRTRLRIKELDELVQKVRNCGICFEDKLVKLEGVVAFCHAFESTLRTIKKSATEVKKAKKTYESIPLISPAFDGILKQLSAEESLLDSLELLLSDETAAEDYESVESMLKSLGKVEYYDVSTSILGMFKRKCRLILRIHHGITRVEPEFSIPLSELISMRAYASKQLEIMKEAQQEQILRWNPDVSSQTKSTVDSASNSEGCESLDVIYSFLSDLTRKCKSYLASLESNKSDPIKAVEEAPDVLLKFIDIKAEIYNLKAKLRSRHPGGPRVSIPNDRPMLVPLREAPRSESKQELKQGRFSLNTTPSTLLHRTEAPIGVKPRSSTLLDSHYTPNGHRTQFDGPQAYQHDQSSRPARNPHVHEPQTHTPGSPPNPSRQQNSSLHSHQHLQRTQHLPMQASYGQPPAPSRHAVSIASHQQRNPIPTNGQTQTLPRQPTDQMRQNTALQTAAEISVLRQHTNVLFRAALGRNPFLFASAEEAGRLARDLERKILARSGPEEYTNTCGSVVRLLEKLVALEKVSRLLDLKDFCVELIFILMNKSSEELSRLNRDQASLQRVLDEANRNLEQRAARPARQGGIRPEAGLPRRSVAPETPRSPERGGNYLQSERDFLSKRRPHGADGERSDSATTNPHGRPQATRTVATNPNTDRGPHIVRRH